MLSFKAFLPQVSFIPQLQPSTLQGLCHAIARIFGDRLQVSRKHGYVFPFAPKSFVAGEWREPWANVEPVCWKWLEPRPNLFAEYFEAIHGAEVHPSLGPPQQ